MQKDVAPDCGLLMEGLMAPAILLAILLLGGGGVCLLKGADGSLNLACSGALAAPSWILSTEHPLSGTLPVGGPLLKGSLWDCAFLSSCSRRCSGGAGLAGLPASSPGTHLGQTGKRGS